MKDNTTDTFEITDNTLQNTNKAGNFFLDETSGNFDTIASVQGNIRHINDYDYNILKEDAYKDISDDTLKLEYKITKTEEDIKHLESQISAAKEINDIKRENELKNKLELLKRDYDSLINLYNEKAVSAKITDSISGIYKKIVGTKISAAGNFLEKLYEKILLKLPKKFVHIIKIKQSLNALRNINNSVNGLVSMTIPYGENVDKYNSLSQYIIKANSIHAEISKYIKS